jgi:hypothetical protein
VALPDPPRRQPLQQEGLGGRQRAQLPPMKVLEVRRADEAAHVRLGLGEVLLHVGRQHGRAAEVRDQRRGLVERDQRRRQPAQRLGLQSPRPQQGQRAVLVGEPPHPDRVVGDGAGAHEGVTGLAAVDRDHTSVHVRRQPRAQPHLLVTGAPSLLDVGVVEEAEVHRPLHLPRLLVGEEDPGGVGLRDRDRARPRRRERGGARQVVRQPRWLLVEPPVDGAGEHRLPQPATLVPLASPCFQGPVPRGAQNSGLPGPAAQRSRRSIGRRRGRSDSGAGLRLAVGRARKEPPPCSSLR